jgi:hypothetical protein
MKTINNPPRSGPASPGAARARDTPDTLAAMRAAAALARRAARADLPAALEILGRAGAGRAPDPGDELPPGS